MVFRPRREGAFNVLSAPAQPSLRRRCPRRRQLLRMGQRVPPGPHSPQERGLVSAMASYVRLSPLARRGQMRGQRRSAVVREGQRMKEIGERSPFPGFFLRCARSCLSSSGDWRSKRSGRRNPGLNSSRRSSRESLIASARGVELAEWPLRDCGGLAKRSGTASVRMRLTHPSCGRRSIRLSLRRLLLQFVEPAPFVFSGSPRLRSSSWS
jgi:hypothetical protein